MLRGGCGVSQRSIELTIAAETSTPVGETFVL